MMGGPLPLPVIYVLEATGLSGGVKNVLEQANRLYQRGVDVRVASLGARPRWFPLRVPFLRFRDYRALVGALKTVEAIKVATWWNTAQAVWESCDEAQGGRGIPVYLVQDIETSYYPNDAAIRERVAETYRLPMACLTIAPWIATHLRAHYGREAIDVSIAVDHDVFFPQRDDSVDPRSILACARPRQRIKGFDVTLEAVRRVRESLADVSFVTYGLEPFQVTWIRHRHLLRPPIRPWPGCIPTAACSCRVRTTRGSACPFWRPWRAECRSWPPAPRGTKPFAATVGTACWWSGAVPTSWRRPSGAC